MRAKDWLGQQLDVVEAQGGLQGLLTLWNWEPIQIVHGRRNILCILYDRASDFIILELAASLVLAPQFIFKTGYFFLSQNRQFVKYLSATNPFFFWSAAFLKDQLKSLFSICTFYVCTVWLYFCTVCTERTICWFPHPHGHR